MNRIRYLMVTDDERSTRDQNVRVGELIRDTGGKSYLIDFCERNARIQTQKAAVNNS